MTLPDWLRAQLIDAGHIHPDGVTRIARYSTCPDCGRGVLRGLDDDRCAWVVTTDPHEIDAAGEMLAFAIGLRTFTLRKYMSGSGKSGWSLDPRYPAAIEAGMTQPVVAQHRCGISIPAAAVTKLPAPSVPSTTADQPDF
jgi:hypothetical protein